jgi:alkanesulfonate monooxygenase SsuD/methylene tetrahydromethanopterin reductase-like flavin-dependent oxidoreductase (luciferase family)
MAASFQFGLVVRGQAEPGEDIAARFDETIALVRLADRLGYDSITKTAHYSAGALQRASVADAAIGADAGAVHRRGAASAP